MSHSINNAIRLAVQFCLICLFVGCQTEDIQPAANHDSPVVQSTIKSPVKVISKWISAQVEPNDGLFQVLEKLNVKQVQALELINRLRFEVDMTTLRVGQTISVLWGDDSLKVEELKFEPNQITTHHIKWQPDSSNYSLETIEKPTTKKYRFVHGVLKSGSTVDQILYANDIPSYLVQTINGVLLCKISFRSEAQPGDEFSALLEEDYFDGKVVRGNVLYTSYKGRVTGFHEAFRYQDPKDDKSSFNAHYTPEGEALIASGLRYPVDRLHVSSNYGMRRHPVTGKRRMHSGVDYAAPRGTRVYSVAPGRVVVSSYDQYSGNKVAIKHADKSTSYYLHLNKRLVRIGQDVISRQLIGRVGATGRVTGPHLHFGFKKPSGQWMNPARKKMIATPQLEGDRLVDLKGQIAHIKEQREKAPIVQAEHPLPSWPEDVPFLWLEKEKTI